MHYQEAICLAPRANSPRIVKEERNIEDDSRMAQALVILRSQAVMTRRCLTMTERQANIAKAYRTHAWASLSTRWPESRFGFANILLGSSIKFFNLYRPYIFVITVGVMVVGRTDSVGQLMVHYVDIIVHRRMLCGQCSSHWGHEGRVKLGRTHTI